MRHDGRDQYLPAAGYTMTYRYLAAPDTVATMPQPSAAILTACRIHAICRMLRRVAAAAPVPTSAKFMQTQPDRARQKICDGHPAATLLYLINVKLGVLKCRNHALPAAGNSTAYLWRSAHTHSPPALNQ
jgi:hypothetical protein